MAHAPALLVVAHGSRDPRHAATVAALTARVRGLAPGLTVATGFLDFCVPGVDRAMAGLYAAGERRVVALPLLLSRAFHARTDIPAALAEAEAGLPGLSVARADVLGPSPLLLAALERRLAEAGAPTGAERRSTGVVLASAGSSDPEALAAMAALGARWRRAAGWGAVATAYAAAASPTTAEAVRALRADPAVRRVVVAPCVIAPGRLPDRIAAGATEAGAEVTAPVLGPAPELARLLLRRYAEAAGPPRRALLAG
ncbi:sirohydrochlorin chelatase [Streptomyces radicis]|uniref:Sirohydrochlorin chelatase n=1 Tax=Streptomyces radicis TaxID=1750517 RepID=A0A3A9VQB9_9ACTN|nr:CbiX/SirB N-terminal domain-containing protein [Streptomyces radicis]RKN03311.1 sirohydrochlorin chelatase [Streptomyces radicis]RKN13184.1 sirohydrochlorin chelatase [Streptomyces radicis]